MKPNSDIASARGPQYKGRTMDETGPAKPRKAKEKITIEFDRKQYEALVRAAQIAASLYDILHDMVDEKYHARAEMMDDLESWILAQAGEAGMAAAVEIFEGRNVLKDSEADKATDELFEYEEWAFWDLLAHKLADRDVARNGVPGLDRAAEFLEKYEKEFDEHGLDRVEVKDP